MTCLRLPRFIQLHFLKPRGISQPNRDIQNLTKRIPFGGVVRARESSQCIKRAICDYDGAGSLAELGLPATIRSRITIQKMIVEPLLAEGRDSAAVTAATAAVKLLVFGKSQKAMKEEDEEDAEAESAGADVDQVKLDGIGRTAQVTVFGTAEIAYLKELIRMIAMEIEAAGAAAPTDEAEAPADGKAKKGAKAKKGGKAAASIDAILQEQLGKASRKNLQALGIAAAGVDAALFGRMTTNDLLARGDAAVHVTHSMTVDPFRVELDVLSQGDQLAGKVGADGEGGKAGSGFLGEQEISCGLYAYYVVVDTRLLARNLCGVPVAQLDADGLRLVQATIATLIRLFCIVTSGAKKGSTADYTRPSLFLAEIGDEPPRTLVNAWMTPVTQAPVQETAHAQLVTELEAQDRMYGAVPRAYFANSPTTLPNAIDAQGLSGLQAWVVSQLSGV